MGKVIFNMSMSLDGFVAGPNDEVDQLFKWYFSGDTEFPLPGTDMAFKLAPASIELLNQAAATTGAIVAGRRTFDLAGGWGGHPPLGVHHFVVTHTPAQEWVKEGSPFTFVTDGVASAIAKAKAYSGDKNVVISSSNLMQQAINEKLLQEIDIDLVPLLLGKGVRLFENIAADKTIDLQVTRVIQGMGVTHLQYRINYE